MRVTSTTKREYLESRKDIFLERVPIPGLGLTPRLGQLVDARFGLGMAAQVKQQGRGDQNRDDQENQDT